MLRTDGVLLGKYDIIYKKKKKKKILFSDWLDAPSAFYPAGLVIHGAAVHSILFLIIAFIPAANKSIISIHCHCN